MRDRRAAAGGLVFAVLGVAALLLMPPPPAADASAATVRHFFAAHAGVIKLACVASVVGGLSLLPFLATLRRRLAPTAGIAADALFAAGVVTVGVSVLGAVLQAGLAKAGPRLTDSGLLTFFAAERAVFYVAPAVTVAGVGFAAAVAYRDVLPAWLAVGSGVLGTVAAVGGVATLLSDSTAAGGVGLVGFLLTIVWAAASAVVVLREPQPATAAVATPAMAT